MNKIFLIGRLVKNPDIKIVSNGKKVASFSVAVSDGKDQSSKELVQFFNCTAWAKTAEIIESYVQKGHKVAITGKLQNRTWDKPDGTKGYATDIVISELEMLTGKQDSEDNSSGEQPKETAIEDVDLENLPF